MRKLPGAIGAAAACLLTLELPAAARPQWLPVSHDETTYLDFNSIRGTGSVRSATLSMPRDSRDGMETITLHIDCSRWMFAFSVPEHNRDATSRWRAIGKGTVGEVSAELMCPR